MKNDGVTRGVEVMGGYNTWEGKRPSSGSGAIGSNPIQKKKKREKRGKEV